VSDAYRAALLDWMACAVRGTRERAAMAARQPREGRLERTASLGTAGHALDFDDTYLPGIAHLSAPTAPAALVVGAGRGSSVGEVLAAYAEGFEAMGALSRASHPGLYERGWHPTAVCGSVGAAVAAARLLKLDEKRAASARWLALLRAGGMRAAFGSDGKALQVGLAASVGVHAALAAQGRVVVGDEVARGPHGFSEAFGGSWADPDPGRPAIDANWIKPWPCCLLAHAPLEAALGVAPDVALEVVVHPVARAAARYDDVADGLQAKFSIPYLVAFARLRGEPGVESFAGVDDEVRAHAREKVTVRTDAGLGESEALLRADGETVAHVRASRGSPERPLSAAHLTAKVRSLAGDRLDGLLDDPARPAADLLAALEP
jgi:2-methylcitrate dehydratase PrpD